MKFLKNTLLNQSMKMLGSLSLFLAGIIMTSTCTGGFYQPKCPNELLK
ncbi:cyclic lactone autoinducer peptide [Clostridium sp.]